MNTSRKRRGINKNLLNIDYNELNRLKDEKTSFIKLEKCNHHLALHPYHLSNVKKSLNDMLNREICRYNRKLGGIILGFQNVKILGNVAPINSDMCFIHMDVEVEFFIFMPAVEQVHRGIVNKQSNTQIGCLIHKIFNVFLPKPDGEEGWLGLNAHLGQEIQFRITYIDLEGRLPYIRGELLSILSEDSGISTSEELGMTPKRNKKTKLIAETVEVTKKRKLEDSLELSEEPKKKKHKSKKHSIQTEQERNDEEELIVKSTVKKKHKKSKEKLLEELKAEYMEKISVMLKDEDDTKKKKKSKKNKKEKVDLDVSFDLDLSKFFREECTSSFKPVHMAMADAPDRGKPQMNNSTSGDIQWSSKEIHLPPDSEMEEILKGMDEPKKKKSLKRRASVCAELAANDSVDDFVVPPVKKAKRASK